MRLGKTIFVLAACMMLTAGLPACGGGDGDNAATGGNTAPIADAGAGQSVTTGDLVTLSGSGTDADGDTLTYSWSFMLNHGNAVLSDPTATDPTFTPAVDGQYVLSLVVNDGTVDSAADSVIITATTGSIANTAPRANAGPDLSVITGHLVTLNGYGVDADDDPLTYSWILTDNPGNAVLSDPTTTHPSFTPTVDGLYTARLQVNDGTVNSRYDSAAITATTGLVNTPPVADAGPDQTVETGHYVSITGSGTDINGDLLTYSWSFVSWPGASAPVIKGKTGSRAVFTPQWDGIYELSLIVNDGTVDSAPDTVMITASTQLTPFPDTGQITCYNGLGNIVSCTGTGQDGEYYINPMYCNDNGDGTVTDNVTELIWQREDDDTLRVPTGASTYCNNLTLAGKTDWRLPDVMELLSIVNYENNTPPINTKCFPNTNADYTYLTSTPAAWDTTLRWAIYSNYGALTVVSGSSSFPSYVRCVRGNPSPAPYFMDNLDGTVTDTHTDLMWQKCPMGLDGTDCGNGTRTPVDWQNALDYCNGSAFAGHTDWRLPNAKELLSIVDFTTDPAIDETYFPNALSTYFANAYWTSTSYDPLPGRKWYVDFESGFLEAGDSTDPYYPTYVRCVR